jgi:type II secretory pathway pseudopilin PulG
MRSIKLRHFTSLETGVSLIETVVVLGLLGLIAVTFLTGVTTTSRAAYYSNEQTTAVSLARSQMEWIQNAPYSVNATGYAAGPIPDNVEFADYAAIIAAQALHSPDDGIQKITVTIKHSAKTVIAIESYKMNR